MDKHILKMTTSEISGLWATFIQNSAVTCMLKHFLSYLHESEIRAVTEEALGIYMNQSSQITALFESEHIPLPIGFSDADVNLSAPPLYSELYALSFVYRVSQVILNQLGMTVTKVARADIVDFFCSGVGQVTSLYRKALDMMLRVGVYDRPPKMEYPVQAEYVQDKAFLGKWMGEQRPLSALELSEIFFVIEKNYIGLLLLLGFVQTTHDPELKEYFIQGKKLSEKQIRLFNDLLRKEDMMEIAPVTMEVTDSTTAAFSDKLMLFVITTTTAASLPLLAYAMSVSMRKDLAVHYGKMIGEIMLFGEEGTKLMIKRGWLEQPPLAFDRKSLMKV